MLLNTLSPHPGWKRDCTLYGNFSTPQLVNVLSPHRDYTLDMNFSTPQLVNILSPHRGYTRGHTSQMDFQHTILPLPLTEFLTMLLNTLSPHPGWKRDCTLHGNFSTPQLVNVLSPHRDYTLDMNFSTPQLVNILSPHRGYTRGHTSHMDFQHTILPLPLTEFLTMLLNTLSPHPGWKRDCTLHGNFSTPQLVNVLSPHREYTLDMNFSTPQLVNILSPHRDYALDNWKINTLPPKHHSSWSHPEREFFYTTTGGYTLSGNFSTPQLVVTPWAGLIYYTPFVVPQHVVTAYRFLSTLIHVVTLHKKIFYYVFCCLCNLI